MGKFFKRGVCEILYSSSAWSATLQAVRGGIDVQTPHSYSSALVATAAVETNVPSLA
jgi:hypothetical protein